MDLRIDYARPADGAYIAYGTVGEGPRDIVWQMDWLGDIELIWEEQAFKPFFKGLAEMGRLVLIDRRSTGLSSRNVPVPNLETRVSDTIAVLDALGMSQPVLGGEREGGSVNVLLAATMPDRVESVIWFIPSPRSVWAPDYRWGVGPEYVERDLQSIELWGTDAYAQAFVETEAAAGHEISDLAGLRSIARFSRHTATPDVARDMARIWYESDVREVLPAVRARTLLLAYEEDATALDEARHVATLFADAELALLPGKEQDARHTGHGSDGLAGFFDATRRFLGDTRPTPRFDTILSTVLFTDIVDSTRRQAELGDRRWKELVLAHHGTVREALGRWRGVENDTAGDGFYATFDGPARAIRCAQEIASDVRDLGIEVRAGIHTGECELIENKCGGLTVSIGARVASNAGPSEVLVSQTVKDLVAGSGLSFEGAGEHELKGVPDRWRLYRVLRTEGGRA